jgi:hypothetical protein
LLILTSEIRGSRATKESASYVLSQIVLCAIEEPSIADSIKDYFPYLDNLLASASLTVKPDYRWLLLLYCHSPALVFEWAKLPAGLVPTAIASPSRLVEWVVASWNIWKEENKPGQGVETDERLSIRNLGVRMTKTAVAEIPVGLDGFFAFVVHAECATGLASNGFPDPSPW